MTESELIYKFKKGDLEAFKSLYEKYFELVLHYITSLVRNKHESEDLTEELFLYIWEKRESINIKKSFKTYLLSCAHNRTINYFNSKKTQATQKQIPIDEVTEQFSKIEIQNIADSHILVRELRKQIHDAIEDLPLKCRKIFKLSRIYNYKYSQIAEKLGVSVSMVEKQISLALKKLKEELKDYFPLILIVLLIFFS
jgi:RNA polymerase sigma-70 factor (ECF subfamily)